MEKYNETYGTHYDCGDVDLDTEELSGKTVCLGKFPLRNRGEARLKEERHVIWSNYGLDYEEWRDDLEAEYPDLSENERISLMYEINGDYLDDERANLNMQLSQPILVVGDLGLWNGRRMGYKEIPSGNIRDRLYSDTDYSTWYVDRLGDLRCDAIHHDGTNHYLYRVLQGQRQPFPN